MTGEWAPANPLDYDRK